MRNTIQKPYAYTVNDELIILKSSFEYEEGFKGCTGDILRPIFEDEYEERQSPEHLEEYAEEIWREQVSQSNGPTCSLEDWVEENHEELLENELEEYDVDHLDLSFLDLPDTPVCWELIGCGRIFPITEEIAQTPTNFEELNNILRQYKEL